MGTTREIIVYILESNRKTFYCGITNQLIIRWHQHVSGKSKYCRLYGAKMIVHIEVYSSYKEARKREIQIKRGGVRKNWLTLQSRLNYYY